MGILQMILALLRAFFVSRVALAESTVAKDMTRAAKPPSRTWRTFLKNHVDQITAIDFFTVHTIAFGVLFAFLVLRHERRCVVQFNVPQSVTLSKSKAARHG